MAFELNSNGNQPLPEQINIAFAYGFIGLRDKGFTLLDDLAEQFPGSKEIDNARKRLDLLR